MFTDTKNLANSSVNTTNAAVKALNTPPQDEDKFKLKKMWKPIIRLMSRKSALAKNGKRDSTSTSSTIPNNVNLNNAAHCSTLNKDSLAGSLEDNSYVAHKLPLAEFWQQEQLGYQTAEQQQTSTPALEFISKASIDKAPLDTCTNCVYGRNCQHTQFHEAQTTGQSQLRPQLLPPHLLPPQQGFNYFDAEDGCFVWCDNVADDIDENALREWLWQNSWQFAENATVC